MYDEWKRVGNAFYFLFLSSYHNLLLLEFDQIENSFRRQRIIEFLIARQPQKRPIE